MSTFTQSVRLLVGASMVAGGATLAAPLALRVYSVVSARDAAGAARPDVGAGCQAMSPGADAPLPAGTVPQAQHLTDAMAPAPAPEWSAASWPPAHPEPGFGTEPPIVPQADWQPPEPPTRLPPRPPEFLQPQPSIQGVYRSTLEAPPPPLLDATRPPPVAPGWPAQAVARPAPPPTAGTSVPATYRVRDGDDLAGIAARMYGHPAAATAIWAANQDVISDPGLLPIGAALRLPPPWEVAIGGGRGDGTAAIEPRRGVPATPTATASGRRIRVAPGDTLPAIAQRFYGDPAVARRIWELNRDQLRSPELVVPGMELLLP
jgi:nucleoid-associated protein YgaU